ncbi:zinc finger and SCAN domain-containing protein 12-like isoform X6 [Vespula maculifrons]|uniref:Zinc finger and SCAN domain-containing protein 12-like isoform X6 n=1 Tax=Vespula maculifrons TaxID=7453 RepID=A0ABD2AM08_VESMC
MALRYCIISYDNNDYDYDDDDDDDDDNDNDDVREKCIRKQRKRRKVKIEETSEEEEEEEDVKKREKIVKKEDEEEDDVKEDKEEEVHQESTFVIFQFVNTSEPVLETNSSIKKCTTTDPSADICKENVEVDVLDKIRNVCPFCDKQFSNEQSVERHVMVVHQRQYKCDMCKRSYNTQTALDVHKVIHRPDYFFECMECHVKMTNNNDPLYIQPRITMTVVNEPFFVASTQNGVQNIGDDNTLELPNASTSNIAAQSERYNSLNSLGPSFLTVKLGDDYFRIPKSLSVFMMKEPNPYENDSTDKNVVKEEKGDSVMQTRSKQKLKEEKIKEETDTTDDLDDTPLDFRKMCEEKNTKTKSDRLSRLKKKPHTCSQYKIHSSKSIAWYTELMNISVNNGEQSINDKRTNSEIEINTDEKTIQQLDKRSMVKRRNSALRSRWNVKKFLDESQASYSKDSRLKSINFRYERKAAMKILRSSSTLKKRNRVKEETEKDNKSQSGSNEIRTSQEILYKKRNDEITYIFLLNDPIDNYFAQLALIIAEDRNFAMESSEMDKLDHSAEEKDSIVLLQHDCSNIKLEDTFLSGTVENQTNTMSSLLSVKEEIEEHSVRGQGKTIIKYHNCDRCGMKFPLRTMLNRHRLSHNNVKHPIPKIKCSKEKYGYSQTSDLRKYSKSVFGQIEKREYTCNLCNFACEKSITLTVHLKRKHRINEVKSVSNNRKCSSNENNSSKRRSTKKSKKVYHFCDICDFECTKGDVLAAHVAQCHRKSEKRIENSSSRSNKWNYEVAEAKEEKILNGDGRFLYGKESIQMQPWQIVDLEGCLYYAFVPAKQEKKLIERNKVNSESDEIKKETLEESLKISNEKDLSYTDELDPFCSMKIKKEECSVDEQAITNDQEMYEEDNKMYACEECNICFPVMQMLKRHKNAVHEQAQRYKCKVCFKICRSLIAFKMHVALEHKPEQEGNVNDLENLTYTCNYCNYESTNKSTLYSHISRKHSTRRTGRRKTGRGILSEQEEYACDVCEFKCQTRRRLKEHLERKHASEYKYDCEFCGKKFKVKGDMRLHVRFKHKEGPIVCDVCGKTCSNSNSLMTDEIMNYIDEDNSRILQTVKKMCEYER